MITQQNNTCFPLSFCESEREVTHLCPTLCDPIDCSPTGSSIHGIFRARILEWGAFPFPRELPDPGFEPGSPTLQADALPSEPHSSVAQSCPTLCDPMNCRHQASLSITNSRSVLKLMSIELVMPSSHLIFCCPLLFPPSVFPSVQVFSNESVLHIKWPRYWSFSPASVLPMNIQD